MFLCVQLVWAMLSLVAMCYKMPMCSMCVFVLKKGAWWATRANTHTKRKQHQPPPPPPITTTKKLNRDIWHFCGGFIFSILHAMYCSLSFSPLLISTQKKNVLIAMHIQPVSNLQRYISFWHFSIFNLEYYLVSVLKSCHIRISLRYQLYEVKTIQCDVRWKRANKKERQNDAE